jgi:hypothetical protein
MTENKTRMVTFRCEEGLYQRLQGVAGSQNASVSEFLREITMERVGRHPADRETA